MLAVTVAAGPEPGNPLSIITGPSSMPPFLLYLVVEIACKLAFRLGVYCPGDEIK